MPIEIKIVERLKGIAVLVALITLVVLLLPSWPGRRMVAKATPTLPEWAIADREHSLTFPPLSFGAFTGQSATVFRTPGAGRFQRMPLKSWGGPKALDEADAFPAGYMEQRKTVGPPT